MLAKKEEISEFLEGLRELGIGEQQPQEATTMEKNEPVLETSETGLEESPAVHAEAVLPVGTFGALFWYPIIQ